MSLFCGFADGACTPDQDWTDHVAMTQDAMLSPEESP